MSDSEKEDIAAWSEERDEQLRQKRNIETIEYEKRKALYGDEHYLVEERMAMDLHNKLQLVCRAGCGEENPKLTCSKCKKARYCNAACQKEDWTVSHTYLFPSFPILSDQTLLTYSITKFYVLKPKGGLSIKAMCQINKVKGGESKYFSHSNGIAVWISS